PQNDVAPDVRAGASPKLDRLDPRRTVLELDALSKPLDLLRIRLPEQPHRILALEPVARMHQPMCERAVGREEQQPRCVQIEPPDADPPSARRRRQRVEYRAPALRVVTRSDLACRLVVSEMRVARPLSRRGEPHAASVHEHAFPAAQALADLGESAVDGDSPFADPALDLPPGADAGLGKNFLNTFAQLDSERCNATTSASETGSSSSSVETSRTSSSAAAPSCGGDGGVRDRDPALAGSSSSASEGGSDAATATVIGVGSTEARSSSSSSSS